jgi:hypothetical protein
MLEVGCSVGMVSWGCFGGELTNELSLENVANWNESAIGGFTLNSDEIVSSLEIAEIIGVIEFTYFVTINILPIITWEGVLRLIARARASRFTKIEESGETSSLDVVNRYLKDLSHN